MDALNFEIDATSCRNLAWVLPQRPLKWIYKKFWVKTEMFFLRFFNNQEHSYRNQGSQTGEAIMLCSYFRLDGKCIINLQSQLKSILINSLSPNVRVFWSDRLILTVCWVSRSNWDNNLCSQSPISGLLEISDCNGEPNDLQEKSSGRMNEDDCKEWRRPQIITFFIFIFYLSSMYIVPPSNNYNTTTAHCTARVVF